MGAASTILGLAATGFGASEQNRRSQIAHDRSKELMGIQYENQQNLNRQGNQLQKDMFDHTFMPIDKMRDKGINTALLYGMSGTGGATTGSQGGGNAASGNAHAPMDIGASVNAGLAASQINLQNAQAEKIKEETQSSKIENDVKTTKSDFSNIGYKEAQHKKYMQQWFEQEEKEMIYKFNKNVKYGEYDYASKGWYNDSRESFKYKKELEELDAKVEVEKFKKELMKSNVELNEQQTKTLWHKVIQEYINSGSKAVGSMGTIIPKILEEMRWSKYKKQTQK